MTQNDKPCPAFKTTMKQTDISAWYCHACGHYERTGELTDKPDMPLPQYIVAHYEPQLRKLRSELISLRQQISALNTKLREKN